MIVPKITVDTREFNRVFKQYMELTKKDLKDIVNTKAYFIARNAVQLTDTVATKKVEEELRKPSNTNVNAPVAAIIVQKNKKAKGEYGVYGARMTTEINKLIRIRKRTVNFLKAGWIPAIKALEVIVPSKSGPSYRKPLVKGKPKGGGIPARSNTWSPVATIWNEVLGGIAKHGLNKTRNVSKVQSIISQGLQKAINKEIASMRQYVEKKLQQTANRINR